MSLNQFLLLTLLAVSRSVVACKLTPSAYDLDAFLAEKGERVVVFSGLVTSANLERDGHLQHITFKTRHWWRGRPRPTITAVGQRQSMEGTSCEGQLDFIVAPGAEWLIVGEERDGVIFPSGLLSRPSDVEIPAILQRRLGTRRLNDPQLEHQR